MVVARTPRRDGRAGAALIAAREVARQYLALAHRPWAGPTQPAASMRRSAAIRATACAWRWSISSAIRQDRRHRVRAAGEARDAGCVRALHAGDRPHPPDPRAHGAHRPSAGGRRAVWRRARGRPARARHCTPSGSRSCIRSRGSRSTSMRRCRPTCARRWAAWGLRYNRARWLTSQPAGQPRRAGLRSRLPWRATPHPTAHLNRASRGAFSRTPTRP